MKDQTKVSVCAGCIAFVVMFVVLSAIARLARGERTADPNYYQLSEPEKHLYYHINAYRQERNLPTLRVDLTLLCIARQRCPAFNHYQPRYGGWVHEQASRLGYVATDNIASGYATPEEAVGHGSSGWGDERPGHTVGHDKQMKGYAKINGRWINRNFDRIGVAVSGKQYIAVFGRNSQKEVAEKPAEADGDFMADIPREWRERNRASSCVHMSTAHGLRYIEEFEKADQWLSRHSGGESPGPHRRKLDSAGVQYAMTTDADDEFLEWCITNRLMVGITTKPGHCLNLVGRITDSQGQRFAVCLDNNTPDRYDYEDWDSWYRKYKRSGWAFVITGGNVPPPTPK